MICSYFCIFSFFNLFIFSFSCIFFLSYLLYSPLYSLILFPFFPYSISLLLSYIFIFLLILFFFYFTSPLTHSHLPSPLLPPLSFPIPYPFIYTHFLLLSLPSLLLKHHYLFTSSSFISFTSLPSSQTSSPSFSSSSYSSSCCSSQDCIAQSKLIFHKLITQNATMGVDRARFGVHRWRVSVCVCSWRCTHRQTDIDIDIHTHTHLINHLTFFLPLVARSREACCFSLKYPFITHTNTDI